MKYLSEEEIKNELNDYIYNVNIKYATLLNGSWGSGKTFFVKTYIKKLEYEYKQNKENKNNKHKKPIYVSLYGLNSVSEIKNKIALSLVKNEKVKQLLPFVDIGLEVGSEFIANKTFIQSSNSKISKIISALYKIDNLIIFFDDLERCNININSILGYINELVEHNNIKVIIVADENKIGKVNYQNNLELKYLTALSNNIKIENKQKKKDSWLPSNEPNQNTNLQFTKEEIIQRTKYLFNEDSIYNEIKEKLIGKVIYYRANICNIYDIFVDTIITNNDANTTAKNNKKKFLKQLEDEKYYNLRTVQFIFQCFNRLVEETKNIIKNKDVENIYLNDLFSYCTIKSLHIKQGKKSYNWEPNQEFGTVYLGNQLADYIYKNFVVGFRFVDDYIENSYLDKDRIKITLNDYKNMILNEINNPNDPLYKLKTWWLIPEKELDTIIDELIAKIENNDYDLELYSKIVNYLSRIEEMDVCKTKINKAINGLERNIDIGIVNGKYNEDRIFDGTPKTSEIYYKNIDNIKKLVNKKEKQDDETQINIIFTSDDWGNKLKEYCETNNYKFMQNKNFADILNINAIISSIKRKSIEQIYEFWYALQKIYNYSNIKDYYTNDKDKLIELKTELTSIKDVDKVKLFVINKIVQFLEDVISNL